MDLIIVFTSVKQSKSWDKYVPVVLMQLSLGVHHISGPAKASIDDLEIFLKWSQHLVLQWYVQKKQK